MRFRGKSFLLFLVTHTEIVAVDKLLLIDNITTRSATLLLNFGKIFNHLNFRREKPTFILNYYIFIIRWLSLSPLRIRLRFFTDLSYLNSFNDLSFN